MPARFSEIVHVATECTPFFKTGGLADVIGSLPQALNKAEGEMTVILPKYNKLAYEWNHQLTKLTTMSVWVKWRQHDCAVYELYDRGVRYLFLDNKYYFHRHSLYGWHDDAERFAFFAHAVLEWLDQQEVKPSILHCHDWQTGLIPAYIRAKPWNQNLKTVFTIHNLAYQGQFPSSIFEELLHFDQSAYSILEMDGCINYLKAGIAEADHITTVSPTYALEVQQSEFGYRLHHLLRSRSENLVGILNGIDLEEYNPATDKKLVFPYEKRSESTDINKRSVQIEAGLSMSISTPLLAVVSRLVKEKGMGLLLEALPNLLTEERVQVIILGNGSHEIEEAIASLQLRFPAKLAFFREFDEAKARRIYAGADMLLMPSLFEPCGLSQLIALRYGCVPIVRETGGLKDTIQDYHPYTGTGNGFVFHSKSAAEFYLVIQKAVALFKNKQQWNQILLNGLGSKLDWTTSAACYQKLYDHLCQRKGGIRHETQQASIPGETVKAIS